MRKRLHWILHRRYCRSASKHVYAGRSNAPSVALLSGGRTPGSPLLHKKASAKGLRLICHCFLQCPVSAQQAGYPDDRSHQSAWSLHRQPYLWLPHAPLTIFGNAFSTSAKYLLAWASTLPKWWLRFPIFGKRSIRRRQLHRWILSGIPADDLLSESSGIHTG